jgi:hypothetical protein
MAEPRGAADVVHICGRFPTAAVGSTPGGSRRPLVTVLIGGLVVWGVTSTVQRRREQADRIREEKRADLVRSEDLHSRDDALRQDLVGTMTEAAASLYLMTQHYWRAKVDLRNAPQDPDLTAALSELRPRLDAQYLESRKAGEALESRLGGYFVSPEPRMKWHQVMDLLTVRYFQLIDRHTQKLYEDNAGPNHSGLTIGQLENDRKLLLVTYREAVKEAVRLVFDEQLRSRSSDEKPQSSEG